MSQPLRFHLWSPDGRSLCDQFARAAATKVEDDVAERLSPCGACVLLAEQMVREAYDLIRRHGEPTPPPVEALGLLRRTRWLDVIDIHEGQELFRSSGYQYPRDDTELEGDGDDDSDA